MGRANSNQLKEIRQRILKERGIVSVQRVAGKQHTHLPRLPIALGKKTHFMEYLEMKYGRGISIWDILQMGSLTAICKRLGNEVDRSTVSKWWKRYKMKFSLSNLPDCSICIHHKATCDLGVCNLLMELEQYELVELKRKEILAMEPNKEPAI